MKRDYLSPVWEAHVIEPAVVICSSPFGVENTPIDDVDIN
jgi:hypothetical protein